MGCIWGLVISQGDALESGHVEQAAIHAAAASTKGSAMATSMPDGLVLTGALRGGRVEEGRPRASGDGNWPDRYILTLEALDESYRIEFRDEDAARATVGESANVGDTVSVPVHVRAAKSFVFYVARGSAPAPGADSLTW